MKDLKTSIEVFNDFLGKGYEKYLTGRKHLSKEECEAVSACYAHMRVEAIKWVKRLERICSNCGRDSETGKVGFRCQNCKIFMEFFNIKESELK